jgi:hypothetical protein
MATTNDITGDSIQTGVVTDEYRNGHETIFGKKPPRVPYVYVPPTQQEIDDAKAEDEAFESINKN